MKCKIHYSVINPKVLPENHCWSHVSCKTNEGICIEAGDVGTGFHCTSFPRKLGTLILNLNYPKEPPVKTKEYMEKNYLWGGTGSQVVLV